MLGLPAQLRVPVLPPQVHQEELLRRPQDLLQRAQALQGLRQQQQQRQAEERGRPAHKDEAQVKTVVMLTTKSALGVVESERDD